MYRVNSISNQIVDLQVISEGKPMFVRLLPKNFVFSEEYTEHLKNLALNRVIRVTEVKIKDPVPVVKDSVKEEPVEETKETEEAPVENTEASSEEAENEEN